MDYQTFLNSLASHTAKDLSETAVLASSLTAAIKNRLCELDSVALPGFGRFEPVKNDEYTAVDPSDNQLKLYPPEIKVSFVAGSKLKKRFSHE